MSPAEDQHVVQALTAKRSHEPLRVGVRPRQLWQRPSAAPEAKIRSSTTGADKLRARHTELAAGVRTPATYTAEQCLQDWLETLNTQIEITVTGYRIIARHLTGLIGSVKLVDLKVRGVDYALGTLAKRLSTRSVRLARMILIQAIRNATRVGTSTISCSTTRSSSGPLTPGSPTSWAGCRRPRAARPRPSSPRTGTRSGSSGCGATRGCGAGRSSSAIQTTWWTLRSGRNYPPCTTGPGIPDDREALRAELGYRPGERVCLVSVGGSGVGGNLLRRVAAAFPLTEKAIPACT